MQRQPQRNYVHCNAAAEVSALLQVLWPTPQMAVRMNLNRMARGLGQGLGQGPVLGLGLLDLAPNSVRAKT